MSCSSIDDPPLPPIYLVQYWNERGGIAPAILGHRLDGAACRDAVDPDGARLGDALQPGEQRLAPQRLRRMELLRGLANDEVDITLDDDRLVAGEFEQARRIGDEPMLSGVERRGHPLR